MKNLSLLLIVSLLVACSGSIDPVEPPSVLTVFTPELKLLPRWNSEVGKGTDGKYLKLTPLLDGEHLFIADRYGDVRAYHSLSGQQLWQVALERTISAGPGDASGLLLFGGDAEVFAVDKNSGELRWHNSIGSEVLSAPVAMGDTVVVHAVDGSITALNRRDGSVIWRHLERVPSLSLRGNGKPLIVGGNKVVVGNANGQVIALNLQDGSLLWRATIATARGRTDLDRMVDVDADMVAAEGVIYAAAFQGSVAAIQATNGRLIWTREISSQSGIIIDDDALYLSDEVGDVWALSRQNGASLWKQTALHRRALSAPAQQGRYLILGDFEGYLHWLSQEDGHLVARGRADSSGFASTPIVVGKLLVAQGKSGELSAFRIESR
ncbi:MAG: outer membrane protein assembly factor BamB [Gammaproteobacteria bacterium]|nr:outer membrane protein assembly factor BamB [Gammaproteobacteria bacterium]